MTETNGDSKNSIDSDTIAGLYEKLESASRKISDTVKTDLLPEFEKKAKQNPATTLLVAFISGFLLAIFMTSRRR